MSGFGALRKIQTGSWTVFYFGKSVPTYRCANKSKHATTLGMSCRPSWYGRHYLGYEIDTLIRHMVCSESDEESTRNSNDVSISLCAYLSKYRVQTNSNITNKCHWCLHQMRYENLLDLYFSFWTNLAKRSHWENWTPLAAFNYPLANVTDAVAYWVEISLYKDAIGENTYKKRAGFAQRILCSLYHTVMQKWKTYSARWTLKN